MLGVGNGEHENFTYVRSLSQRLVCVRISGDFGADDTCSHIVLLLLVVRRVDSERSLSPSNRQALKFQPHASGHLATSKQDWLSRTTFSSEPHTYERWLRRGLAEGRVFSQAIIIMFDQTRRAVVSGREACCRPA